MLTVLLGLVLAGSSARVLPGPCDLLSEKDITDVAGGRLVSRVASAADGRQVENRRCFFQTEPFTRSISLEWTRDHEPGGARERWNELFHPRPRDDAKSAEGEGADGGDRDGGRGRDEAEERAPARPKTVSGVGEEAFWVPGHSSGALYVFAAPSYLRIGVGSSGTDEEKQEAATALARRALAAARSPKKSDGRRKESRPR